MLTAWDKWTPYSGCSKTCGGGETSKTRKCLLASGDCKGKSVVSKECNTEKCTVVGTFGKWTKWSTCDVTCGAGKKIKTRKCSTGKASDCTGEAMVSQICNKAQCAVACKIFLL